MESLIGCKIAEGGCSEIFEWENNKKIIKLAKANTDRDAIGREFRNNKIAWENGLSVPQPFQLVDIDGRPGIVIERIYGETLMERFLKSVLSSVGEKENLKELNFDDNDIKITARILYEIHCKSINGLSCQRVELKKTINRVNYLTALEKKEVISILDNLPISQQLCHGDPNPNNIFIRDNEPVLIDWMNATSGNPEADLAEYIIMIRFAILPSGIPSEIAEYFNSIREEIIKAFIDEYSKLSGITYAEIDAWIAPIAARKLSADAICEDEKKLLVNEIRKRLCKVM